MFVCHRSLPSVCVCSEHGYGLVGHGNGCGVFAICVSSTRGLYPGLHRWIHRSALFAVPVVDIRLQRFGRIWVDQRYVEPTLAMHAIPPIPSGGGLVLFSIHPPSCLPVSIATMYTLILLS